MLGKRSWVLSTKVEPVAEQEKRTNRNEEMTMMPGS